MLMGKGLPPSSRLDTIGMMSESVRAILEEIRRLPAQERFELIAEVDRLAKDGLTSLRNIQPTSVGQILRPLFSPEDDLLEEMRS